MTTAALDMFQFAPVFRATLFELAKQDAPPCAKFAYIALRSFVRKRRAWWRVAHRTLATVAGLGCSTLRRGLRWLSDHNLIKKKGTHRGDGGQGANEYQILWWPEDRATARDSQAPAPVDDDNTDEDDQLALFLTNVIEEWGEQAAQAKEDERESEIEAARYVLEAAEDAMPGDWTPSPDDIKQAREYLEEANKCPVLNPWDHLKRGTLHLTETISHAIKRHPLWKGTRNRKIAETLKKLLQDKT